MSVDFAVLETALPAACIRSAKSPPDVAIGSTNPTVVPPENPGAAPACPTLGGYRPCIQADEHILDLFRPQVNLDARRYLGGTNRETVCANLLPRNVESCVKTQFEATFIFGSIISEDARRIAPKDKQNISPSRSRHRATPIDYILRNLIILLVVFGDSHSALSIVVS